MSSSSERHQRAYCSLDKRLQYLRINEVPALLVEEIQYLERHALVTFTHVLRPSVAKVHSAQT